MLLLSGCAVKDFDTKYSSHITIRAEGLRYSDMGFIYESNREVKAQIYSLANPVFTLRMHGNICINRACYNYERFNREYLHPSYPDRLINDLFRKRPIFDEKNLVTTKEGFTQKIRSNQYDIIYSVTKDSMRFEDKKNRILIQIQQL